ncbi:MAG: SHOCT domain-containing protein [Shinella sp.]|nr:SHOCT domain-containing protein [Shinella sp.]
MAFVMRRTGQIVFAAALSILSVGVSGCSSTTPAPTVAAAGGEGPDRSGVYPEITGAMPAATTQMSNEEAASIGSRLQGLTAQRSSGAISQTEYLRRRSELEALASGHGAETLKEIQK